MGMGFIGVAVILALAFALSTNRRAINLRVVASAFALQVAIAVLVLHVPAGRAGIQILSGGVQELLNYTSAGVDMVLGGLAAEPVGFSFAVRVLPIVIFFSSLMAVLYHVGVMQVVVAGFGRVLRFLIGTRPVESLNAAANMFVGQTEAPLVVKPYLKGITQPQLFAIMVSGLASVSGSVLAAYAQMGVQIEYLLAASFMAAPGGLLMAKIIVPDGADGDDEPQQIIRFRDEKRVHENVFMAAAVGAQDGLKLALNIAAMLIAFVSLIAMANGILTGIGGLFGLENLTVQGLLGRVFAPLMYVLNVPWSEAQTAGAIFGEKLILNEFVAYLSFADIQDELSPKTAAIVTFALCGFANLSSIAILLGGLGSLVPDRMGQIAKFGLRAVAAGSLSNLMSAALAGLLFSL